MLVNKKVDLWDLWREGGGGVSAPVAPLLPLDLLFEGDMRRSREEEFTYAVFVTSCCVKIETKMAV